MKCPYLKTYNAANGRWSVHACDARVSPYIPSLFEINSFCSTKRSRTCIHSRRQNRLAGKDGAGVGEGVAA